LNSKHQKIKFTVEIENNNLLSFLDIHVFKGRNNFITSVYRKDTFSGLGLSYFSFCPNIFKINSLKTLINRAYVICSSYDNFHKEISFLKSYFVSNGYSANLFYRYVRQFLDRKYSQFEHIVEDRETFYLSLPYFGTQSEKLKKDLDVILNKYFSHINFTIVLSNSFRIGSFFSFKDKLPCALRSKVIYKFCCSQCESTYVGSTIRTLGHRIAEHAGRSYRTNSVNTRPPQSSVRDHCSDCNIPVRAANFSILSQAKVNEIRILESLYIFKQKPNLNNTTSAFPLSIVNR